MKIVYKIAAICSVLAIVLLAYLFLFRPAQLNLGATQEEIARQMPGDEIEPHPTFLATRAITINASPEEIWPWLIQMGYDRAGFYGYDIIEGLGSKTGLMSAERIIPKLQHPAVGDSVPISAAGSWLFHAIEKPHYFVWSGYKADGTPDGGFIWALYPIDANSTRLISRVTWRHHFDKPGMLAMDMFTEFTDHLAMRKIFEGIKDRVEGRQLQPFAIQSAEFFYYVASLMLFMSALGMLLIRRLTVKQYLFALGTGVLFLITWYTILPVVIGLVLMMLIIYWYRVRRLTAHDFPRTVSIVRP